MTNPHRNIEKSNHHLHWSNNHTHHHTTYQTIKKERVGFRESESQRWREKLPITTNWSRTHQTRWKTRPIQNKLPPFDMVSKLVGFNVVYKPRKESLNVGLPLLLHLLIVGWLHHHQYERKESGWVRERDLNLLLKRESLRKFQIICEFGFCFGFENFNFV